jgi:hypothetical protein
VYGEDVSGYRLARAGELVDLYLSDPTFFADEEMPEAAIESFRGHPERFADLLPGDTTAEAFARVVLRPGWWEEYDERNAAQGGASVTVDNNPDGEGLVDEIDRMRCIALALELWAPADYPFGEELEALENSVVGPVIALAFK